MSVRIVLSTLLAAVLFLLPAMVMSAEPSIPSSSNMMAFDSQLYAGPSRGETGRSMREGMTVYPTGNRQGAFLEVKDKFGTLGWVSVEDLQ